VHIDNCINIPHAIANNCFKANGAECGSTSRRLDVSEVKLHVDLTMSI